MRDYTLEINPSSELIVNLNILRREDPKLASLSVKQAFDTALFQAGIPLPSTDFSKRSFKILETLLKDRTSAQKDPVVEEVERIKEDGLKDFKDGVKLENSDMFADFKIKGDK